MTRKKPDIALPEFKPQPLEKMITLERYYEVITPLFGGSAIAGKVDEDHPIRGSSIRGHLRFWWRATQAGRFTSVKEMKVAEDALWGSAETPSQVTLSVQVTNKGKAFQDSRGNTTVGDVRSEYSYVAFPLREEKQSVQEGVEFILTIHFPADENLQKQIKATLWAWDTFGGIGARTRRGFGALSCQQCVLPDKDEDVTATWCWKYSCESVLSQLEGHMTQLTQAEPLHSDVPQLGTPRTMLKLTSNQSNAVRAWTKLVEALKQFRQSRELKNGRPYGRSHWPEPDAIRDRTGQSLPGHDVLMYGTGNLVDKFPRAQFGLPIIFEFKQDQSHPTRTNKDPRKTELVGRHYDRLASPLIIRPLMCGDNTAVGIALVLDAPRVPPGGLKLNNAPPTGTAPDATIDGREAGLISTKHPTLNNQTDVLKAFLDTL